MRRLGETFASNLDRDALLEIVVRDRASTASAPPAGGRGADSRDGPNAERARSPRPARSRASSPRCATAETAALERGTPAVAEATRARQRARASRCDGSEGGRRRSPASSPSAAPAAPFTAGRARAVRLPRRAGGGLARERRAARDRRAPGGHRRAHRACSTARRFEETARRRGRALAPLRRPERWRS